ncbi:tRNA (adenosine(37)-N6)-threonylcarbamoyltransferase complex dimerization subunit type 1 TsaB [Kribbella sp. NPDC056345]|uniref:tRNA (adenosine(37)-N6)-threonylcarbamoyltransferase complex dimerization subunit type 1 TsaB n=1 Tax=Kribbella sp. NPDC056345 TaxID=3345789 RepID=UPI0035DA6BDD
MLLAFDTSSAAVTVAIADPVTGAVVASSTTVDALRHGELLAPAIAAALAEAGCTARDLTRIAVGVGPGPFTGLRVGLVTARTMADVLGIEVAGVCSLDILAHQSELASPVAVATDARRKEIYWALYDGPAPNGTRRRLEGPAVDKPANVAHVLSGLPVIGRGAVLYADALGIPASAGAPPANAQAPNPTTPATGEGLGASSPSAQSGAAASATGDGLAGDSSSPSAQFVVEYPSAEVLARGVALGTLEIVAPDPLYLRRPDVTMSGGPKSVLTK